MPCPACSLIAAHPGHSVTSPLLNLKTTNPIGPAHCPIRRASPINEIMKSRRLPLNMSARIRERRPKPWSSLIKVLKLLSFAGSKKASRVGVVSCATAALFSPKLLGSGFLPAAKTQQNGVEYVVSQQQ